MNYIYKVQAMVLTVGLISTVAINAQAQTVEEETVCYLRQANGSVVDLTRLCGVRVPNRPKETAPSLAEKQAQFIRAFYQKLQGLPQEKDVLAQVDPDALIGKANQLCAALSDGTYEKPPVQQPDEPYDRQLANLEDTIVDQVARRYFCPSSN